MFILASRKLISIVQTKIRFPLMFISMLLCIDKFVHHGCRPLDKSLTDKTDHYFAIELEQHGRRIEEPLFGHYVILQCQYQLLFSLEMLSHALYCANVNQRSL